MKLKAGCHVPFAERLQEEYKINGDQITANVGTDKIESVMPVSYTHLDVYKRQTKPIAPTTTKPCLETILAMLA